MTLTYDNNSMFDDIKISLYAHVHHHGSIVDLVIIFEIAELITLQESALGVGICVCAASLGCIDLCIMYNYVTKN